MGVGTASPGAKLDVSGTTHLHGGSVFLDTIKGYTTGDIAINNSSDAIVLQIKNAGNVGIGTAGPVNKLDVRGTVVSSEGDTNTMMSIFSTDTPGAGVGASLRLGGSYTTGDYAGFATLAGVKENATDGNYAGALKIMTRPNGSNLAEMMRITSTGNVGIGTTTPGQKLSVAGDILGNNIIGSYFTGTSTTASTLAGTLSVTGGSQGGTIYAGQISAHNYLRIANAQGTAWDFYSNAIYPYEQRKKHCGF